MKTSITAEELIKFLSKLSNNQDALDILVSIDPGKVTQSKLKGVDAMLQAQLKLDENGKDTIFMVSAKVLEAQECTSIVEALSVFFTAAINAGATIERERRSPFGGGIGQMIQHMMEEEKRNKETKVKYPKRHG